MNTTRLLATSATAVVLALGLSACGADDDAVPASSASGPAGSQAASSSSTPSADASQAQPGNDDDVTDAELRRQLEQVALDEVGEGRVSDVEYSDDRDHAYEVDVELGNDDDVTVEIAEDLSVVRVDR